MKDLEKLDLRVKNELEYLTKKREKHKGEWITQKVVDEYRMRVLCLQQGENLDVGERRMLRVELEERYGLTELEAINILNGNHVPDILRKYERIQKLIPLEVKKKLNEERLE